MSLRRRFPITTISSAGSAFSGGTVANATTFTSAVSFLSPIQVPAGDLSNVAIALTGDLDSGVHFMTKRMVWCIDLTRLGGWNPNANGFSVADTFQFMWSATADGAAAPDTGTARVSAAKIRATNGSTGLGYFLSGTAVTPNTGTATPAVIDSGTLYSNTGDADGSIITLPNDPTIGTTLEAFANVAQAITINAATGESIQDGITNGTSTVSSTQGAWMRLVAVTGGSGAIWGVAGKLGTWVTT